MKKHKRGLPCSGTTFYHKKLYCCGSPHSRLRHFIFHRFDTTAECDGRTDRRTHMHTRTDAFTNILVFLKLSQIRTVKF